MSTAGLGVVVSPLCLFVTLCLPSIPDFVSAASLWCLVCLLPTLFTGVHLEGPFINREKKGAHCEGFIRDELSQRDLEDCYGSLDNVCIVTLAPELKGGMETIEWLVKTKKIVVSLGGLHSMSMIICYSLYSLVHLYYFRALNGKFEESRRSSAQRCIPCHSSFQCNAPGKQ